MSSLVINTNTEAIAAYNNLNATDQAMSTAVNRLSSGLKVQTAADNASGYVISQFLTEQSNGLGQAISNGQ
ncbi:MAG: flagellin, partial [Actinomycetota bacterium]|nr:flagellin [Actinomycetota bacterium]